MEELDKFVEEIKSKKNEYTELELVRYVYILLGQNMSFDLQFFYGNNTCRNKVYKNSTRENIGKNFKNKTVICKSLAYLFEYILKKLDISVETVIDYEDGPYYHVSNIIILKDGTKLPVDLQHDLENIQVRYRTKYFGKNILTKQQLEKIDTKIGYISENNNYTEEYFYLLKKALSSNMSLIDKIRFIIKNVNVYIDISNIKYIEKRRYYYYFVQMFITKKEKNKVHFIDAYQMKNGPKEYRLCIVIEMPDSDNITFLYSDEKQTFEEYSLEELSRLIKDGLVLLGNIPGIRKYMNNNKQKMK